MTEKILGALEANGNPTYEVVDVKDAIDTVILRSTDNHDNQIRLPVSVLEILAGVLKDVYHEYYPR